MFLCIKIIVNYYLQCLVKLQVYELQIFNKNQTLLGKKKANS